MYKRHSSLGVRVEMMISAFFEKMACLFEMFKILRQDLLIQCFLKCLVEHI